MSWFSKKEKKVNPVKGKTKTIKIKKYEAKPYEVKRWQKKQGKEISKDLINDKFAFSKEYFDLLARYVPSVSGAIWTWVKLCNTPFDIKFIGGSKKDRNEAKKILESLNRRMNPMKMVKNGGISHLLNIYFNHLFKYGRTGGQLEISKDLKRIEGYKVYNPYNIRFEEDTLKPVFVKNPSEAYYLNDNTFYYYAQNMDLENPYGTAMLEATPSLVKILDDLLVDMANSSSNAGVPRLHVGVTQPEQFNKETNEEYVSRSNEYFEDTTDNLSSIGSDENFYTWSDVEI